MGSPWLDVGTWQISQAWAGNLAVNDPLVNPLYGSLNGLPPTAYVYSGSPDRSHNKRLSSSTAVVKERRSFVLAPGKSTTGYAAWGLLSLATGVFPTAGYRRLIEISPGRPRTRFQ